MNTKNFLRQSESVLNLVARFLDTATVVVCGMLSHHYYHKTFEMASYYQSALLVAALLTLLIFPMFETYRSWRGRTWQDQFKAVFLSWSCVVALLVLISALLKITVIFSRMWFFVWAISTLISILFIKRLLVYVLRSFRRRGWNRKGVIILGAGDLGRKVAKSLREDEAIGFDILAFFDDNTALHGKKVEGVSVEGGLEKAADFLKSNSGVREVWLTLPLRAEQRVRKIIFELRHSTAMLRFVPDIFGFQLLLSHSVNEVAGISVVDMNYSPMDGINFVIKEIEDRILALLILCLISPILLLIALAIRLESPGPVIFKQRRHGWDGREINVYKFRSMRVHQEAAGTFTQATKKDPRVTRVGAFIRKTSLDELPQFFNVLQGRMSIVGPRPHPLPLNEQFKDQVAYYFQRHKVKPGITGWAQVNGWRGETDTLEKMQKRVEYDLYYIQNWSLWLDIKIIFLTFFKGFINERAY